MNPYKSKPFYIVLEEDWFTDNDTLKLIKPDLSVKEVKAYPLTWIKRIVLNIFDNINCYHDKSQRY